MGVDHGRADVLVTQEFLDCSDVVSILQEMRRKGVAQGVGARRLGDTRPANRLFDGPLDRGFVEVVPPPVAGLAVHVPTRRGEDPLPRPFPARVGILPVQPARQDYPAGPFEEIPLVLLPHPLKVSHELVLDRPREQGHPVLLPLAVPDQNVVQAEVHILDPQLGAFQEPEPFG